MVEYPHRGSGWAQGTILLDGRRIQPDASGGIRSRSIWVEIVQLFGKNIKSAFARRGFDAEWSLRIDLDKFTTIFPHSPCTRSACNVTYLRIGCGIIK